MTAIKVVFRPSPANAPHPALAPLYGLFDVMIDGVNITARAGEGQALAVLGEVAQSLSSIISRRSERETVQLYAEDQVWELALEADGEEVLVSVYRAGRCPDVAIFERRLRVDELSQALSAALDEAPVARAPRGNAAALRLARRALGEGRRGYGLPRAARETVRVEGGSGTLALSATVAFRVTDGAAHRRADAEPIERADVHALLARGDLRMNVRERSVSVRGVYPLLFAERLLLLADEVLEAWIGSRPIFRRINAGGVRLAVRQAVRESSLSLTLRGSNAQHADEALTFPQILPADLARVACQFVRSLSRALTQLDATQERNLRLTALMRDAEQLEDRVASLEQDDSVTNPDAEAYRAFGLPSRGSSADSVNWQGGGKMRFRPRWVTTVADLDLRATFLCGRRLIAGSAREIASIDRQSGAVQWRAPAAPAASVVTPSGLLRWRSDGHVALYELETGQVRFGTHVAPRARGGATGAVVHAPGLPKLAILAEGERSITAVDLVGGDIRWRYTAKRPASFRLRRAGRLVLAGGGDSALVALDVVSGQVAWRVRDRLPFSGDCTVDRDSAFCIAGGAIGPAKLHHIDVWSGAPHWSVELEDKPAAGHAPLVTSSHVIVITRGRKGTGAVALERATGKLAWTHEPGLASGVAAFLSVDDCLIANTAAGTLLCLDGATGRLRYSHVFPRHVDAETSRRLEPILRNGALFVPQYHVHVVRPQNGEVLGNVPGDIIPDLVRVDERCDVYIAEESGHLAAFGVGPRLTLVKG